MRRLIAILEAREILQLEDELNQSCEENARKGSRHYKRSDCSVPLILFQRPTVPRRTVMLSTPSSTAPSLKQGPRLSCFKSKQRKQKYASLCFIFLVIDLSSHSRNKTVELLQNMERERDDALAKTKLAVETVRHYQRLPLVET